MFPLLLGLLLLGVILFVLFARRRSLTRLKPWCQESPQPFQSARLNPKLRLEYRQQLAGKDAQRFRQLARAYLLPWRFHLPKGEQINVRGIAIWRLIILVISLVVIADSLPIDALRVTILYPFLQPTQLTRLPLDLLIGLQWLLVPGIFFLWFAEYIGWVPREAAMFPVEKKSLAWACGALALLLCVFSLSEFYRLNEYGQCLLVEGCRANPLTVVFIVAGFTLMLSLAGILSLIGVIYGLRALVALWYAFRAATSWWWKQRLKLRLLAREEEYQAQEEERILAERDGVYKGRVSLPVLGPPQFRQTVDQVLSELQQFVPHRYKEVLAFLPKAEYAPGYPFAGRSDGLFTIDGSGESIGKLNTYDWFKFVFLHELGHCVRGHLENDWSEDAANAYANLVLGELEHNQRESSVLPIAVYP